MLNRFLSPDQLHNYLTVLQENGMLVYEEAEQTYKTTPKGMYFLQIYNQVGDLVAVSYTHLTLPTICSV